MAGTCVKKRRRAERQTSLRRNPREEGGRGRSLRPGGEGGEGGEGEKLSGGEGGEGRGGEGGREGWPEPA